MTTKTIKIYAKQLSTSSKHTTQTIAVSSKSTRW